MMRAYELMVIVDGDVDDPKAQSWVKFVSEEIGKAGGSLHGKPNWWGKRAFAYPINKKEAGYYLVVECVAEGRCPRRARAAAPPRGRDRPSQADPTARGRGEAPRHGGHRRLIRRRSPKGAHPCPAIPSP
jgi:ribosomal protein S6